MTGEGASRGDAPGDALAAAMARVALGDRDAFAEVYDAMAPKVLGVTRAVLRNPSLAEEVAQEVMVELWRQAGRFDPSAGSVGAWAATIAHRRAVDRVRSVRAREDREDRVAAGENRTAYDEVSEQVLQHDDETRVRAALGGLTELQRETVLLAYWGGRTSTEISQRLGVPVPTVKTRLRDGLARLRADMSRQDADLPGPTAAGAPSGRSERSQRSVRRTT
ncbi:RNA polymerase sigma-70 factor, ECF subfamily [Quadrisphaera granulorum]|uniref:RNA polymerase sigma-70 factor (ECF subfamily) n=1 Tax=Quadrisphaera granulorum TaxID=317664 RepID=A0A316A7W8_9ACTN|nr:ECF RNA polymerase sigma factor SigK [Quadrisphaera granulorum]PWJ53328.1 RNA polymerase sigma-70 factor (ECF subfamily) [Quadrisphaera granulorum]SZE97002.1 RNA polymerase sigma-70 factor, ECF subfamily [Quadrisphaera granulorum]